jgi:hypothetical protein
MEVAACWRPDSCKPSPPSKTPLLSPRNSLSRTFLPSLSTSQLPQKYLSQFLHDPTTTFTSTLYLLIDHPTTKNKPPGMLSLFFLSASASSPSLGRVRSPPPQFQVLNSVFSFNPFVTTTNQSWPSFLSGMFLLSSFFFLSFFPRSSVPRLSHSFSRKATLL